MPVGAIPSGCPWSSTQQQLVQSRPPAIHTHSAVISSHYQNFLQTTSCDLAVRPKMIRQPLSRHQDTNLMAKQKQHNISGFLRVHQEWARATGNWGMLKTYAMVCRMSGQGIVWLCN